jgi:hypothetical protein
VQLASVHRQLHALFLGLCRLLPQLGVLGHESEDKGKRSASGPVDQAA